MVCSPLEFLFSIFVCRRQDEWGATSFYHSLPRGAGGAVTPQPDRITRTTVYDPLTGGFVTSVSTGEQEGEEGSEGGAGHGSGSEGKLEGGGATLVITQDTYSTLETRAGRGKRSKHRQGGKMETVPGKSHAPARPALLAHFLAAFLSLNSEFVESIKVMNGAGRLKLVSASPAPATPTSPASTAAERQKDKVSQVWLVPRCLRLPDKLQSKIFLVLHILDGLISPETSTYCGAD